jgi:hypothetical protein
LGHKRILGKTADFITGRQITDTDDERYRQKLARFLVEIKGYGKSDIEPRRRIEMVIDGKKVLSLIDFVVSVLDKRCMVIKYGPGSLVTRERPALAAARILGDYQIPVTVVTNGEDAEILDTASGDVIGTGIDAIPDKASALEKFGRSSLEGLSPGQIEAEKRIISAYDYLEHSLECDDDWCETDSE